MEIPARIGDKLILCCTLPWMLTVISYESESDNRRRPMNTRFWVKWNVETKRWSGKNWPKLVPISIHSKYHNLWCSVIKNNHNWSALSGLILQEAIMFLAIIIEGKGAKQSVAMVQLFYNFFLNISIIFFWELCRGLMSHWSRYACIYILVQPFISFCRFGIVIKLKVFFSLSKESGDDYT